MSSRRQVSPLCPENTELTRNQIHSSTCCTLIVLTLTHCIKPHRPFYPFSAPLSTSRLHQPPLSIFMKECRDACARGASLPLAVHSSTSARERITFRSPSFSLPPSFHDDDNTDTQLLLSPQALASASKERGVGEKKKKQRF